QAAQLDSGEAKANVLAPISADQLGNLLSSDLSAALALPDHNHDHDNVKFDGSTESDGHLGGTFDV
ncbi:MAG TPA: hypothetical protein VNO21_21715, partial [Polyangiaceae bacterium]|nr:hypothetical protein [Polyangiaceae bacterium]